MPSVVGSPAKTNRPPGLSTRTTSRSDSSTSGMWCSTAWPTTRSKVSSSYGMPSASATRPSTSSPSALTVAGGHLDHARRQVGHRAAPGHPGLDQVQQEEPGAAAQLERAVVGQFTLYVVGHDRVEAAAGVVDAALVVARWTTCRRSSRLPSRGTAPGRAWSRGGRPRPARPWRGVGPGRLGSRHRVGTRHEGQPNGGAIRTRPWRPPVPAVTASTKRNAQVRAAS